MENAKNCIIGLFYDNHLQVKEIALKINTSSAYVTKVIKQDARYNLEKNYRKNIAKVKRKVNQNEFIKKKREQKKIDDNYSILEKNHNQDVCELSEKGHLTNEAYRKWNSSAYTYNPSKKRYEFNEELGRAADVPKYIKERK